MVCSEDWKGSRLVISTVPTPRDFACSIWFQSNSSTEKSAPTREGYVKVTKTGEHSSLEPTPKKAKCIPQKLRNSHSTLAQSSSS